MMKDIYPQNDLIKESLKGVVFAGAITGQLVMGYVGDWIGRNRALSLTVVLAGFGALSSAVCSWGDRAIVYAVMAVSRFILGVGVGGVYPLSATKAAEESATNDMQARNLRVSKVFFWQMPGAVFPYIIALLLLVAVPSAQIQFRILLALGAIPSFFIYRATASEEDSSEFRRDGPRVSAWELLKRPGSMRKILATGGCWFIYDVVYYGTALFSPTIVANIFGDSDDLIAISWQNIIVTSVGIPAVVGGMWFQQVFGTRSLQIWGFVFIAVCFALLASLWVALDSSPGAVFFLFILLMVSLNWGPNISTFILPAEVYEPKVRATMNGVAAAMGKTGAIVGTYMYQPIYEQHGIPALMWVAAAFSLLGAVISVFTVDEVALNQERPGVGIMDYQRDEKGDTEELIG